MIKKKHSPKYLLLEKKNRTKNIYESCSVGFNKIVTHFNYYF